MDPTDGRAPNADLDAQHTDPGGPTRRYGVGERPLRLFHAGDPLSHQFRAIAFDLDAASLLSLREALPGWEMELVTGATAASLSQNWNPGAADLFVVKAGEDVAETFGLCRLLASCSGFSTDFRGAAKATGLNRSPQGQVQRTDAPLLVLVPPGQEALVRAALEAGAQSCLILPIHAQEVITMLSHARAGNQPGRHTLNLEQAQHEDLWRDDGGQG
jgi:hypothetical protein